MLAKRDLSSGVITNDQAPGLVDTNSSQVAVSKSVDEVTRGHPYCLLEYLVKMLKEGISGAAGPSDKPLIHPPPAHRHLAGTLSQMMMTRPGGQTHEFTHNNKIESIVT
jgi:hypothetical protein